MQTQTSGLGQILVDPRQDSLGRNEGVTALALLGLNIRAIDAMAKLLFEILVRIKGSYGANTRGPHRKGERAPMRLVDLLPGLKFRQFRIQNQTVKIKHNGAYHNMVSIVQSLVQLNRNPFSRAKLARP